MIEVLLALGITLLLILGIALLITHEAKALGNGAATALGALVHVHKTRGLSPVTWVAILIGIGIAGFVVFRIILALL